MLPEKFLMECQCSYFNSNIFLYQMTTFRNWQLLHINLSLFYCCLIYKRYVNISLYNRMFLKVNKYSSVESIITVPSIYVNQWKIFISYCEHSKKTKIKQHMTERCLLMLKQVKSKTKQVNYKQVLMQDIFMQTQYWCRTSSCKPSIDAGHLHAKQVLMQDIFMQNQY